MRQYATTTMSSVSATTATPPTAVTPTNSHSYLVMPPGSGGAPGGGGGAPVLPPVTPGPSLSDLRTSYLTDNTDVGSSSAGIVGGAGPNSLENPPGSVLPLDGHQTIVDSYEEFLVQSPLPPPPPQRAHDPIRTIDLDEEAGNNLVFGGRG